MWSCPICRLPLVRELKSWRCSNAHSFDCASEGYVNLLLPNQKSSQNPGDNKLMINARREFLDRHYYSPLIQRITRLVDSHSNLASLCLHDAGCGEGYYTHGVSNALTELNYAVEVSGHDISKWAIAKAAKKYPAINFAVASSFAIPKSNQSVDLLLQIFAPAKDEEVRRILRQEGLWLRVTPGPDHLFELKQELYAEAAHHEVDVRSPEGFEPLIQDSLRFELALNETSSRENLLMMTPFYWSAQENERQEAILQLGTVTADFNLTVLVKA